MVKEKVQLVTTFENKDYKALIKDEKAKKDWFLNIHYGCDYVGIAKRYKDGNQGCFHCYERQKDLNNNLIIENNAELYVNSNINSPEEVGNVLQALLEEINQVPEEITYIIKYKDLSVEKIHVRSMEDCPCCGKMVDDNKWKFDLENQDFSTADSFRVKDRINTDAIKSALLNVDSGLFQYIFRFPASCYIPILCSEFNDVVTNKRVRSFGRSFSMKNIETSALLEGLERYSGMYPRRKKSKIHASYNEIKEEAVNPEDLIIHTRPDIEEFGLEKYNPDKKYNWIWIYDWKEKKNVLLPEQVAYYDIGKNTEEKRFIYETSNGIALGGSLQEAVLYGLYELIERDAFLVAWYNKYKPVKLDLTSIQDEKIRRTIDLVKLNGYKLHVFDITTENKVPTVWVMIENPSKDAKVRSYSAAGAHTNPYKAIEAGLVEVITSMPINEQFLPDDIERAKLINSDFSKVTTMEDHVLMYSIDEAFERLQYLFEDEEYKTIDELYPDWKEQSSEKSLTKVLTQLMDKVSEYHKHIYIVDQTNDLIEGLGLYCAKVIVPSMQTMHFGEQFKRLNKDRIMTGAVLAGWRDEPIREEDINDAPHPFP